jgi:hypothetical protein
LRYSQRHLVFGLEVQRAPLNVTASKKPAARIASACERRNAAQVCEVRSGTGAVSPETPLPMTGSLISVICVNLLSAVGERLGRSRWSGYR